MSRNPIWIGRISQRNDGEIVEGQEGAGVGGGEGQLFVGLTRQRVWTLDENSKLIFIIMPGNF